MNSKNIVYHFPRSIEQSGKQEEMNITHKERTNIEIPFT